MLNGSTLIPTAGTLAGYLAPATGPAAAAELSTVSAGQIGETGQATNGTINALGTDVAQSTILHGVADSIAAVGSFPGVAPIVTPLVQPTLGTLLSDIATGTETPVSLLAPHSAPAAAALLSSVGDGNITATGQSTGASVTGVGSDISQSTILHGTANAVTALTNEGSFHFPTAPTLGSDSLSGILGAVGSTAHAANSTGASLSFHTASAHFDIGFDHPLHTLAHAAHHA